MDSFANAFHWVIGHEGGYTDDPKDPGNWTGGKQGVGKLLGTKFGIAANSYPDLDIRNLTLEQARAIYRRDYWDKVRGDELPPRVAFQLFDMAVNHGRTRAIKIMQQALGFTGAAVDGAFGPATMARAKRTPQDLLIMGMLAERLQYYTDLKTWGTFGKGWTRRVAENLRLAAKEGSL